MLAIVDDPTVGTDPAVAAQASRSRGSRIRRRGTRRHLGHVTGPHPQERHGVGGVDERVGHDALVVEGDRRHRLAGDDGQQDRTLERAGIVKGGQLADGVVVVGTGGPQLHGGPGAPERPARHIVVVGRCSRQIGYVLLGHHCTEGGIHLGSFEDWT